MSIDSSRLKSLFRYEEPNEKLKGKVISVVNQIPYNCILNKGSDVVSTLETGDSLDATPISHLERRRRSTIAGLGQTNIWKLSTRRGHSAMYAALDSLKKDYRTLYIGGTGAIYTKDRKQVESNSISSEEKSSLKDLLATNYDLAPIFLDDKLSFGHYEGYSKQGK